ncbi:hypothetical protein [Streptomyces sp. NPDC048442]|uniref:hypothetical protein n=1 Tax=Streptomyces sp. NPDC048442 TaxID=3154823 RepID=UPI003434DB8B
MFVRERTRHKQRAEKMLEDAQIKLSSVVTDLFGKSGRLMMDALVGGKRSPAVLAGLACGSLRGTREALALALRGGCTEHHAFMLGQLLQMVDTLDARINDITVRIEGHLARIEPPTGHRPSDGAAQHRQGQSVAPRHAASPRPPRPASCSPWSTTGYATGKSAAWPAGTRREQRPEPRPTRDRRSVWPPHHGEAVFMIDPVGRAPNHTMPPRTHNAGAAQG